MRMKNRYYLLLVLFLFCMSTVKAQLNNPVKWKFTAKKLSDCEYELVLDAVIEDHWHLYSQKKTIEDGPNPASFRFDVAAGYELLGSTKEGKAIKVFDKMFEGEVLYFEKKASFKQKIKLKTDKKLVIKGELEYQACTDEKCIFPPLTPFEFIVMGTAECIDESVSQEFVDTSEASLSLANIVDTSAAVLQNAVIENTQIVAQKKESSNENRTWWAIFIAGFLGGLAALLTPCVFPMIPMTVSFFTKSSKTKAKGISNAIIYGVAIIALYVALGLGVTMIFGSDALNAFSTNIYFNLFFFLLLVIFAISFLGAFEIVLPAAFVNKIDSQSDRGGLIGIFFMAFTLSLVSFSCTGPIIGTLLVDAAVNGGVKGPFWGMLGFSSALALPFGLFAAFPGWLNSLPKSGGWLNSIKVVLGFLELALALKFASNADLVIQAGILTREVFLVLWIVIFGLMGIYLMGWIKFSHDSDLLFLSVPRLFFAILTFAFTIYMIPGLWGAPLKLISGFPPPDFYSESPSGFGGSRVTTEVVVNKASSASDMGNHKKEHCPNNLPCFHDYDEALAYAKKVGKPLMIDFTGWACVNCRKMESQVWTDSEVDKRLRNDVVLVSLYVDDKNQLPLDQQTVKKMGDRDFKIKTIGNKWSFLQADKFKTNTQPQYILLDHNERLLSEPTNYDPDIENYIKWLDAGKSEFLKRKK